MFTDVGSTQNMTQRAGQATAAIARCILVGWFYGARFLSRGMCQWFGITVSFRQFG